MPISLSEKQSEAWHLLEDDTTNEVLYGGAAGCFLAGTLVATDRGHVPIERIRVGDMVKSFNVKTKRFEYKKILETFTHNRANTLKKIVTFEFDNETIKCTDNHEFYIRGNWIKASRIAERIMEGSSGHDAPLLCIEQRQACNYVMERFRLNESYEASYGCERVSANYDKTDFNKKWKADYYKNTQNSSSDMVGESEQPSSGQPHRWEQTKQLRGQFRVGKRFGKYETCLSDGFGKKTNMHQFRKRLKDWNKQTYRRSSERDKTEVQTENIHQTDVSGRISCFTSHYKGRYIKTLEARRVSFNYSNELVYDLCVEDNHNYCVSSLDIVAHNSGKSKLGCIWHIYRRMRYPNSRGLIGRAKLKSLEESTLVTLFETCAELGYQANKHFNYNAQKSRITWANGSVTMLKDLFAYPSDPDFASLGSTEFTDAFIDECTEITAKAKQIVYSRIRWKLDEYNLVPKLLMTCNPAQGWVKETYISNDRGAVVLPPNKIFVNAKVWDNPNPDFVKLYVENLMELNDYDRARLLDGDWDVMPSAENPFFHLYDSQTHTGTHSLDEDKPLVLSIDFNMNPFACIAAHLWRDEEGEHAAIVDEIEIKKGSIPAMIDEIKLRYGHWLRGVRITGDASGNKGEITQRDNASNYLQLMRGLNLHHTQIVVPRVNPTHSNSRADCNYILKHFPDFTVSKTCKNMHFDLKNVQCDAFGSLIKRDRNDLTQRGDYSDCLRYLFNTFLKKWATVHAKNSNFAKTNNHVTMQPVSGSRFTPGLLGHLDGR